MDTLFFRDGRPFEVGGEANLQIPPSPSTFYGALRSALIVSQPGGVSAFISGNNPILTEWAGQYRDSEGITAKLKIKGPVFAKKTNHGIVRYFPLPRDVLIFFFKDSSTEVYRYFLISTKLKSFPQEMESNMALSHLLINPFSESGEYQPLLISEHLLFQYLQGGFTEPLEFTPGEDVLSPDQIYLPDYREGIGLKKWQKNLEKGRLFTQQQMAFVADDEAQMGFLVESDVPKWFPSDVILRLGGDGKVATFQPVTITENSTERIKQQIEKNKLFKVYLATPALFELGKKSRAFYNGFIEDIPGLKFELQAAAIGRAEMYGGYDIAVNVPKISFPAVPASSVFYLRLKKGTAGQVLKAFHNKCISDFRNNQGFGYSFVGGITNV